MKKKRVLNLLLILFAVALLVFLLVRYTGLFGFAVGGGEGGGSLLVFAFIFIGLFAVLGLILYEKIKQRFEKVEILRRFRE